MRRLTLRSKTDDTFRARVVERDGLVFVLDFGDKELIQEISGRLHNGFEWAEGALDAASTTLLERVAAYYEREGWSVDLSSGDAKNPTTAFSAPPDYEDNIEDDETELVNAQRLNGKPGS